VLPFEFVIAGPPVSQQTRRRRRLRLWIESVRAEAFRHWQGQLAPDGPVRIRLTYFYDGVALDLDNIAKPVLDALKGLAYLDDDQVTDIVLGKRDLGADLRIENPSAVLAGGFELGTEFLHVLVEEAPDQELMP
jgi:Holliday junction resolvase RusA-like endonuclease